VQGDRRARGDSKNSRHRKGSWQAEEKASQRREQDGACERDRENDAVAASVEVDLVPAGCHGRGFGGRGSSPPFTADNMGLADHERGETAGMRDTARRAFLASLIFVSVVAAALALWELKILIALMFLAFTIAAAMRPGIEAMQRRGIPRGAGIAVHYLALAGLVGLLLWLVVPRALNQVREALPTRAEIQTAAEESSGIRQDVLVALREGLEDLPSAGELFDPALEATVLTFEIFVGVFFVLASAAYWVFERDRAIRLVTSLLPRPRRKLVRDTWDLVDLKLGAYVRGQGLLIVLVGTVLSLLFMAIGLPYWLLIGVFAGVVEIVPVLGPLTAGALAVGVGLTDTWQVGLAAGVIVLVVRLLEDYLVIPRVLGDAVGLSPLLVLFSVTATAILFGGFAVILAIPLAAVIATLVDVIVLNKNPADEEVPTVIFPAKDAETVNK
jgi:predicted PurR-regulated permease PerM